MDLHFDIHNVYFSGIELVGPAWRVFAGNGFMIFWAVTYVLMGVVAYFIRDSFNFQLALNVPVILLLLVPL